MKQDIFVKNSSRAQTGKSYQCVVRYIYYVPLHIASMEVSWQRVRKLIMIVYSNKRLLIERGHMHGIPN